MAKEYVLSTGNLPQGGLPRNNVDRITDRPDMTLAFHLGYKAFTQQTNQLSGQDSTQSIHVRMLSSRFVLHFEVKY